MALFSDAGGGTMMRGLACVSNSAVVGNSAVQTTERKGADIF